MIAQAAVAEFTPASTQHRRHPRQRRQRCKATAAGGDAPPPGQPSRDAVLARIAKAREYKKAGPSAAAPPVEPASSAAAAAAANLHPPPQEPALASALPPPGAGDVEQAFSQAADQLAAREEAEFLQAAAQASSSGSGDVGSGQQAQQASSEPGRDAVLARIEAARRYNQQVPAGGSNGSSGSVAAALPPSQAEQQRSFRTGGGGAEQAANWLVFADRDPSAAPAVDPALSAEQFTLAKEELQKQREVEIITVDAAWAAQVQSEKAAAAAAAGGAPGADGVAEQGEEGDELHKPKVATWGVFPRPRNISEAYGGGRNLRPGQALESEEAAAERSARVSAALQQYRKTLGLDVDPAVEARAQGLYDEGMALFDQGLVSYALPKFAEAAEAMALRSRLGGEARLQQAICLDSLGQNEAAYELYKRIENHSAPGVAKKAKRMLFGWKAAENLKTTRLSYQPTTAQWKRYFDAINRNAPAAYVAPEEEQREGGDGLAAALALGVALLPVGLVAARALLP